MRLSLFQSSVSPTLQPMDQVGLSKLWLHGAWRRNSWHTLTREGALSTAFFCRSPLDSSLSLTRHHPEVPSLTGFLPCLVSQTSSSGEVSVSHTSASAPPGRPMDTRQRNSHMRLHLALL